MGLDCTHDAWSGAYSAFDRWRRKVAELKGLPPLELMEGFYVADNSFDPLRWLAGYTNDELTLSTLKELQRRLPIKWDVLKPDPIHYLLWHSDCDGIIEWWFCKDIADSLEEVIPLMPSGHIQDWKQTTQNFVDGLLVAYYNYEHLGFH